MDRVVRGARRAVLAGVAAGSLALAQCAAAAPRPSPADATLAIVRAFARMPSRADGNVVDPVTRMGAAVYAQATLGEAALVAWRRTGDPEALAFGERMLGWVGRQPVGGRPSPFELGAAAEGYALLPVASAVRAPLRRWLQGVQVPTVASVRYASNHDVAEADALLSLCRLQVRPDSATLCRAARHLVATRMALAMRPFTSRAGRRPLAVFADPPHGDPAYQQLVLGFLAHIVRSGRAPTVAPRLVLAMARGTLAMVAPNGDAGYWGRSQEQAWAQALGAYGLRVAATLDRHAAEVARFRHAADLLLKRFAASDWGGPYAIFTVPAAAASPFGPLPGLDPYLNVANSAGLTAVGLAWLSSEPAGAPARRARLWRGRGTRFPFGEDAFATTRRAGTWLAVREHGAFRRRGDLRSDFGLVALQHRVGHRWRPLLALRPRTGPGLDSAGPVLHVGRRIGYPDGTAIRVPRRGTVVVRGGWRTPRGGWLRRATFRFRIARGGARLTFRLRAGDRVDYSVFAAAPRRAGAAVVDEHARTVVSLPARVRFTAGYASAEASALVRATLTARARRAGRVTVAIRPRG